MSFIHSKFNIIEKKNVIRINKVNRSCKYEAGKLPQLSDNHKYYISSFKIYQFVVIMQ